MTGGASPPELWSCGHTPGPLLLGHDPVTEGTAKTDDHRECGDLVTASFLCGWRDCLAGPEG